MNVSNNSVSSYSSSENEGTQVPECVEQPGEFTGAFEVNAQADESAFGGQFH